MSKFKPGQSGNPSGRPKGLSELRELARQRSADALAALVAETRNTRSPAARVRAAEVLLAYGFGRPTQATAFVDTEGNDRPLPEPAPAHSLDVARRISWLLAQGLRAQVALGPDPDSTEEPE